MIALKLRLKVRKHLNSLSNLSCELKDYAYWHILYFYLRISDYITNDISRIIGFHMNRIQMFGT
jgi:hypothetical protein